LQDALHAERDKRREHQPGTKFSSQLGVVTLASSIKRKWWDMKCSWKIIEWVGLPIFWCIFVDSGMWSHCYMKFTYPF
jgi:hypothetical protein